MAYTLEEIKELVETLTPIVKNAIEAGSLSVEDLRVAESMDFVNSLPALEEKGLNVSYVKVRLKDLLGKLDGDYAKELEAIKKLLEKKVDNGYSKDGNLYLTSGGIVVSDAIPVGSGSGGGGGASSLGELTNVDDIVDQDPDESRVLVQEAGSSLWTVKNLSEIGGGGGGGGVTMKLMSVTDTLITTVEGAAVTVGYNFTSVYQDDGSETGPGTATYTVNSQKVGMVSISQGNNYFDPTEHLITGSNTVRVTVKDSTGSSRSLSYTIEVISMSISSSIDPALVYSGEIVYRYTPVGAINKTVHFVLDGKELGTVETSASNRQLTYVIPRQTHGAHLLQVYMTALINEELIRSNTLTNDLICIVEGDNTPIVASSFAQTAARQYDRLTIPFVVYTPDSSLSEVTLSANNATVSTQSVDRTLHEWNYRIPQSGDLSLKISSGSASRTFTLTVSPAEVIVEPEKANLQLWLTSQNRSNNDNNRNEWKYGDISADLTGFNFKTNGWISERDSTSLRVSGDARVRIPLKIFKDDFRATGKTIEFEFSTRDVTDYEAIAIECVNGGIGLQISSQKAVFSSEQTTIDTRFKEEERVRISFVVEKRTLNRLIYIYINGIMSGAAQYPSEDNFQQKVPQDIVIGSEGCTIDLYNIRVYDNDLNQYQMLDNFIGDLDDYDKALAIYNRNQVYNDYGDITYQKVLERLPCLIFEGPLPTYKGDKKTNKVYFTDLQEPGRSFSCENVQNDVQGTSSQYYPRKNWKFKFKADITYTESGRTSSTYALRANSIPVNAFCVKADFAESSGTHNTGMAKVINSLLIEMGLTTPPQKTNKEVRTTVDGYPIAIFHRETASDTLEFVGKYNFNNDKSTAETFGFSDGDESWEFSNNTSDRCLFKSADFSGTDWMNDFESRYPDDDAINAEYEAGTRKPEKLMAVTSWVVSTKDNLDKFKNEVRNHFNLDNLIAYYLITELFGMVDQRAKNMFLTYFHEEGKWIFIFYDNDTCFGLNNEGLIAFGYNIEYHDKIGTLNVWNGESSVLWNNLEKCFPSEIEAMYKDIRTRGLLSYDLIMSVLNGEQSDKWCEAIYNADGRFKYIDPLIEEGNGSYLYAAQGSRIENRKWWTYNRFLYIDSKYTAGSFLSDFATLRLYTPREWTGVSPSANMTIIPYADQYTRVKYGSYMVGQRTYKDVPVLIEAPDIVFNDTETIIYGASRVKSLGDMSGLYAGTIDVSKATRLSELLIGSGVSGYQNTNLTVLSIGTNNMLRKLDIRNCPNLRQAVDISGCENMEEVYAQGTSITSVVLPAAGILSKLYLPATLTGLTLRNQSKLTDAYFEIAGVTKLTTIVCEDTGINVLYLVERCLGMKNPVLNRVRLININANANNLNDVYKLIKVGGIDENGNNLTKAVVTGKLHVITATEDKLAKCRDAFPELVITYTNLLPPTITTFVFRSSQSKSITNGVFDCDFEFEKVNEYTYKVTADDDSVIDFNFKCDNHQDFSDSYLVAGTRTQTYTITYIPLRTIRVKVYGQNVYPSGASVIIGDKRYVTDTNGYVYIRGGEAVSGTVEATGYGNNTFNFPAIVTDSSDTVEVYATVAVKFIVKIKNGDFLKGATVSCDGKSKETNLYGECTLQLLKGTYDYEIIHPSCYEYINTVNVRTYAITVNAELDINPLPLKPVENGNIQMMLDGLSCMIDITSLTANYIIDWGDGNIDNANGEGSKQYTHTYSDKGFHQVEIINCEDVSECVGAKDCLCAYWSIGNSNVNNITFNNCKKVVYVGDVFKNDVDRTTVSSLFFKCSSLVHIDLAPLAIMEKIKDAYGLFYECSSLVSLDLTPLAKWTKVYRAANLFAFCSSLKNIDLAPLANWINIIDVSSIFYRCNFSQINLTPLANWINVENASGLLYYCTALKSINLEPLRKWEQVINADSLFDYCNSLESIDLTPLSRWSKVRSANRFIEGCSSLKNINLTPLASWVNVDSADYFMSACKSLETTDLTPLANWINIRTAKDFFNHCERLGSIDLAPLASWTKLTDSSSFFSSCQSLKSIDLTPVRGWIDMRSADSLFSGCFSLSYIDLTPLESWTNITRFPGAFSSCVNLQSIDLTPLANFSKMTYNIDLIRNTPNLAFIIVLSTTPFPLTSGALTNGNTCPIYVPDDAVDTYKTATNWSAYASRIKPISEKTES